MQTRSEAYFMRLFGASTLRDAVEAAVVSELSNIEFQKVPVDVLKIAKSKGFAVTEDLKDPGCGEGQLIPVSGGYRVRLRRSTSEARKRFSIAHEIGHSYFYRDDGAGPRHVIGVLNTAEHKAEEKICDLFAAALLMPNHALHWALQRIATTDSPSSILSIMQQTATQFRVSIPALFVRINGLELKWPPSLLVYSRIKPNIKTGLNPKLRIEFSVGLGEWSNRRFWNGTPVADANIVSALQLYERWVTQMPHREVGQFVAAKIGMGLARNTTPPEYEERGIQMSANLMGLWKQELVRCISSSALYTWNHNEQESSGYIVTAISPSATPE